MADPSSPWSRTPEADLVLRLHATPHRMVYAFAGAGSQALTWLHAVGGSSRTILEAHDHYHPISLAQALGAAPDRSASHEVAAGLARGSRRRARELASHDPTPGPTLGLGLAATIATDRAKRGSHRVHVAAADGLGLAWDDVVLDKGARDRLGEEVLASLLLLRLAAEACGIMGLPEQIVRPGERRRRGFDPNPEFAAFLADPVGLLALDRDGRPRPAGDDAVPGGGPDGGAPAVVSGSFHPLHDGHRRLAEAAERHLGRAAVFEMPVANADKDPLDTGEVRRRASQFFGLRPALLTHAPLFSQKADALPGAVFVVGADTARRVVEPRFYGGVDGMREALNRIRGAGCRFLVAGRTGADGFVTVADLGIPAGFEDLFEALPSFRVDVSSTDLRSAWP